MLEIHCSVAASQRNAMSGAVDGTVSFTSLVVPPITCVKRIALPDPRTGRPVSRRDDH